MPTLSPQQIARIQADFASTALADTAEVWRRPSSGSAGAIKDKGYTEYVGTFPCYVTARIRQPDPDPQRRSYAVHTQIETEDERHLWLPAGCPVQRSDKITVNGNYSYSVTNFVDDYTPMPGVLCAVQRLMVP